MALYRLDAFLSEYSSYSRREGAALIRRGSLSVDGKTERNPSAKIDPSEKIIMLRGVIIPYRRENTLMMNKPAGVVSAVRDELSPAVTELIAEADRYPVPSPAGRLDKDTTGLLLLTSDGAFLHRIISPKNNIYKTYRMICDGALKEADAARLAEGLLLADGEQFLPGFLTILDSGKKSEAEIRICEGKYHEIKRMMAALGKPVLSLKRTAIGGLQLDAALPEGAYRRLTEEEKQLALVSGLLS